jgi:hypothetical protein
LITVVVLPSVVHGRYVVNVAPFAVAFSEPVFSDILNVDTFFTFSPPFALVYPAGGIDSPNKANVHHAGKSSNLMRIDAIHPPRDHYQLLGIVSEAPFDKALRVLEEILKNPESLWNEMVVEDPVTVSNALSWNVY